MAYHDPLLHTANVHALIGPSAEGVCVSGWQLEVGTIWHLQSDLHLWNGSLWKRTVGVASDRSMLNLSTMALNRRYHSTNAGRSLESLLFSRCHSPDRHCFPAVPLCLF